MKTALLSAALVLLAGPVQAAGHGASSSAGNHSSGGGAKNRYQASWSLVVPEGSTTGETVVVFEDEDEAGHAAAADGHGEDAAHADATEDSGHGGEGDAGASARVVDIPTLVAPIVVNGELVNYAFVAVQVQVADGHDLYKAANETAYLRDAMIRSAHRTPLNLPDHAGNIDRDTATRVWTTAATQILGEGVVESVRIVSTDVRHPELAGGH